MAIIPPAFAPDEVVICRKRRCDLPQTTVSFDLIQRLVPVKSRSQVPQLTHSYPINHAQMTIGCARHSIRHVCRNANIHSRIGKKTEEILSRLFTGISLLSSMNIVIIEKHFQRACAWKKSFCILFQKQCLFLVYSEKTLYLCMAEIKYS